jgi:hypothetical protein
VMLGVRIGDGVVHGVGAVYRDGFMREPVRIIRRPTESFTAGWRL